MSKEYNPASWGFTCSEPQESDFWKHLLRFYWFFSLSIIAHEERRLWKPSCANSLHIRRTQGSISIIQKMFSAPRCNILVPLERETLKNMAVNSFTISKVFLRKKFFFKMVRHIVTRENLLGQLYKYFFSFLATRFEFHCRVIVQFHVFKKQM